MVAGRVSKDWRLDLAYPLLARLPTVLPWRLASRIGRETRVERAAVEAFLSERFACCFPGASADVRLTWARSHTAMLAQEMVDGLAFHRLGRTDGPSVSIAGDELVKSAKAAGKGVILVLNHVDRLLTAPVALARCGVKSNVLTMPVLDNPELGDSQRRYLISKIQGYTKVVGGLWRSTSDSLRPVHQSLREGGVWIILADAWRPEFGRLRPHPFLGGTLSLPTGIERLARSTGARLLYAVTRSRDAAHLDVSFETLPGEPEEAVNQVIQQLAKEVTDRPWAWWQWGILDRMWNPSIGGTN